MLDSLSFHIKTKGKRNKFTFLYSICIDIYIHIYLYIGGVEYCRIILHVLINKPRQKTGKYTVWVVHKCFPSIKLSVFLRLCPSCLQSVCWPNGRPPSRCFAKNGSARQTGHGQQSGVKSVWVLLCKRNWNEPTNSHTRACTFTTTYIHTYTRTKYMASNVESRQLNKWHFLLCFFFSWYRHNQTLCSSSTLVWVRYNEYNIPPFFFHQLFTHRCKIDQRSKTLTFTTIWNNMKSNVFFCYNSL